MAPAQPPIPNGVLPSGGLIAGHLSTDNGVQEWGSGPCKKAPRKKRTSAFVICSFSNSIFRKYKCLSKRKKIIT
jgi:hypothetical protein